MVMISNSTIWEAQELTFIEKMLKGDHSGNQKMALGFLKESWIDDYYKTFKSIK